MEPEKQLNNEESIGLEDKVITYEVPNIISLWLELDPGESELEKILKNLIENGENAILSFERWSKNDELTPYAEALEDWDEIIGEKWEPISSSKNHLEPISYISEYEIFVNKDENLHQIIGSAYKKVYEFLEVFKKYLRWYWINERANFSLLFDERVLKPVETLVSTLMFFDYQKKKFIEKIPVRCNFGLLKIDCKQTRKEL